jgi:hypothetical protein
MFFDSLLYRDNQLGPAGWRFVMEALAQCTLLESLNGCSEYRRILAGGLANLDIAGKELALAVGPFLNRSVQMLTVLDMR